MEVAIVQNKQDLDQLEDIIRKGRQTFYEIGKALTEIRERKLYRDVLDYETFEEYCKERWEISIRHADRLMLSYTTIENIKTRPIGLVPVNEGQARPLTKLEPEQQKEAWQKVVENASENKITARLVSKIVSDILKTNVIEHITKTKHKIEHIRKEEIVDEEVKKAFEAFYWQVQNAKLEKWAKTSKQACLQMIEWINDLIEI